MRRAIEMNSRLSAHRSFGEATESKHHGIVPVVYTAAAAAFVFIIHSWNGQKKSIQIISHTEYAREINMRIPPSMTSKKEKRLKMIPVKKNQLPLLSSSNGDGSPIDSSGKFFSGRYIVWAELFLDKLHTRASRERKRKIISTINTLPAKWIPLRPEKHQVFQEGGALLSLFCLSYINEAIKKDRNKYQLGVVQSWYERSLFFSLSYSCRYYSPKSCKVNFTKV